MIDPILLSYYRVLYSTHWLLRNIYENSVVYLARLVSTSRQSL